MSESVEPRYPYVCIDVEEANVDEASGELFDLGALGVEERDATTLIKGAAGKVTLVASFATHEEAEAVLGEFPAALSPRIEEVIGDAWRDEWKKHFRPFLLTPELAICPPWETYEPKAGERVLVLEPGRAFGTGLHETTSIVAEVLSRHAAELRGRDLLDVGCGSGILSLVALELGAKTARAIDIDPDAVAVTIENATRNSLSEAVVADTTDVGKIEQSYPIVLANIEARTLIPLAKTIASRVSAGGLLVLSGILEPQGDDVLSAYHDFDEIDRPQKGEWIGIVLRKRT